MRVEHKAWSRGREAAGLCRVHLEGMTSAERRGRLPMHTTRRTTCTQPRNGNNARARTWPASGCISGAGTSIGSARSGSWRGNYGSRCNELPIHPQRDVPGQAGAAARHGALRQPDCSQTGGAVDGPAAGIDYRSEEKDMSDAKWTPVPGYEICRDGTILSHATNWRGYGSRPISWADDGSGYPAVRMTEPNGRRRKFKVHQLVCRAFHGERPTASHEVRHLDGNPMNNHADNLAWGTRSENALDRSRHGTQHRPNWSDPEFRERRRQAMRDGWAKKKQRVLS